MKILFLLREILLLGLKIVALWQEAQRKAWLEEGKLITEALNDAKTDEDRQELARRLFEHRPR